MFLFAIISFGCGASTEVSSVADYNQGKFDPGFLFGMSPDDVKKYADGITDSRAKNIALDAWERNFSQMPQNQQETFTVGKVIIANEMYRNVTVGVEGPMIKSWRLSKNEVSRDNLIPGEYLQWWNDGSGKKYLMKTDYPNEYEKKIIGYPVEYFHGEACSGVIVFQRKY